MSYVYTFYNCFSPYPQAVYSLYSQATPQNSLQSSYLPNTNSPVIEFLNTDKNEANLPHTQSSFQSLSQLPGKCRARPEKKQIKKEFSKSKDQNFGWRNQNKDRNIISNILKGCVNYVLHERGMVKLIEQHSKKSQLDNGVSHFYEFMTQHFPSRKSYVGIRYILEILKKNPSQSSMAHLLSLTLRHYLKQIYPLIVIQSPKMKKKSRLELLKKARIVASYLFSS